MPEFEFTATAECDRCGGWLSASDADCDNCSHLKRQRFRFFHISDDRRETVWAITPVRAWKTLGDIVGREPEDILPWRLQYCGMSLHFKQRGYDVTDEETLRQPNL